MLGQSKAAIKQKPFHCPHCKVRNATVADLRMHMKSSHSKIKSKRFLENNSIKTLNEDTSLLNDSDSSIVTLDELPHVLKAIECEYKLTDDDKPKKDMEEDDKNTTQQFPKVEDTLSCKLCDFDTELKLVLDDHKKNSHESNFASPDSD